MAVSSIKHNLATIAGSAIITKLIALVVLAVLSRILTPSDFGLMALAMVFISIFEFFANSGVGLASVQLRQLTDSHFSILYLINVFTGLVAALLCITFAESIAVLAGNQDLAPILKVLGAAIPLLCLSQLILRLLQREREFKRMASIEISAALINGGIAIVLAMKGWGVWALVFAFIGQVFWVFLARLYGKSRSVTLNIDIDSAKEVFRLASGNVIHGFLGQVSLKADTFIVGKMLGVDALGFYSRGIRLSEVIGQFVITVVDKVFLPEFSRVQDDIRWSRELYLKIFSRVSWVIFPVSVCCLILADPIVLILLGEQWSETVPLFQVFAVSLLFKIGFRLNGLFLRGTGRVFHALPSQAVYCFFLIAGAVLVAPLGLQFVALVKFVAMGAYFVGMARVVTAVTELKFSSLFYCVLPQACIALVSLVLGYFFIELVSDHCHRLFIQILLGIGLVSIVFGAGLMLLFRIRVNRFVF